MRFLITMLMLPPMLAGLLIIFAIFLALISFYFHFVMPPLMFDVFWLYFLR